LNYLFGDTLQNLYCISDTKKSGLLN